MKKTITHFDAIAKIPMFQNLSLLAFFQALCRKERDPKTNLIDKSTFRLDHFFRKWKESQTREEYLTGNFKTKQFLNIMSKNMDIESEMWEVVGLHSDRGQQNIHVGPVLERMLASTDVTSVPKGFLKFPFDAFYIVFEDSPNFIWDGYSEDIQVKGAYVVPDFRGANVLKIVVWGADSDTIPPNGLVNDAMNWTSFDLDDLYMSEAGGYDFEKSIRRIMSDPTKDTSVNGATTKLRNIEVMVAVIRTVINTILYANSEHADSYTAPRKKSRPLPKKLRYKLADNRPTTTYLGRKYETSENRDVFVRGIRQCRRHFRKGHWRGVWIGTRKDAQGNPRKGEQCVLRWILPTLVNGDAAIEVPSAHYIAPEPSQIGERQ